jgi:uncharacterized protein YpmB
MMDDKKLEEMYAATMENNRMLKGMRRSAFVGGIVKFVWWIVILIVLPYFTWLYIQPYLENVMSQYQNIQGQAGNVTTQAADLQKQLDALKGFDLQSLYNQFVGGGSK